MSEPEETPRRRPRPRPGDIWELKIPGKRKVTKEVGRVEMTQMSRKDGSLVRRPYVNWARLPKGRYSGIRVKWLLKHGRLVSTRAERDAEFEELIRRRKAERAARETKD